MAVSRLLFGAQFGESLVNLREEEQWIISKSVRASWGIENPSFGDTAQSSQRCSVACDSQYANESPGTFLGRHFSEFTNQSGIICFIVSVLICQMGLIRRIAR